MWCICGVYVVFVCGVYVCGLYVVCICCVCIYVQCVYIYVVCICVCVYVMCVWCIYCVCGSYGVYVMCVCKVRKESGHQVGLEASLGRTVSNHPPIISERPGPGARPLTCNAPILCPGPSLTALMGVGTRSPTPCGAGSTSFLLTLNMVAQLA